MAIIAEQKAMPDWAALQRSNNHPTEQACRAKLRLTARLRNPTLVRFAELGRQEVFGFQDRGVVSLLFSCDQPA